MSELSDTNEKHGQTSVGRKVTAVTNPGDCACCPLSSFPHPFDTRWGTTVCQRQC